MSEDAGSGSAVPGDDLPPSPIAQQKQRIRDSFDEAKGGGWQWTSYEQTAPNGDVIGILAFLCCPLCGAAVAKPDEEVIKEKPHLDWPTNHVEHHVRLGF